MDTELSGSDFSSFESLGFDEDGKRYWYARDVMSFFGYADYRTFASKVISRAMVVPTTLGMPSFDFFRSCPRDIDGERCDDFKMDRFACFLTAMNADPERPAVALVQTYLAGLAATVHQIWLDAEAVQRVEMRDDITQRENSLEAVVRSAGINESKDFAFFKNAGYRGMYNMNLSRLREIRLIPSDRSPLDFMGRQELAANLFRESQVELKINTQNIRGPRHLNDAHLAVGKEVRRAMIRNTGIAPEDLPKHGDIRDVKKHLKHTKRGFEKIDGTKDVSKGKPEDSDTE
ncbi:damage-inducible protein D [candidate division KSB1 bacterium]|nr:damage-inducible protein D [candidate division KSB1 bacterium]